ncbi:MAG TPA: hypothetical protein VEL76_39800, partial [Gemmataceae bacterium]|nr:hypothetical protein [Gemmataceae bacterium]
MNRVTVLLLVALLPARALAQSDRFEVGQRLRAFETAWEEHKDEAARKRALAALEKVTVLFFKGSLDEVARTFDQARHLLTTAKEPSATVRWAGALAVRPAARFLDNKHPELSITVASFYKVEAELPKDAILKLTLRDANGKALAEQQTPITALPLQTKPSLDGVHIPEGDHTLEAVIVVGK